MNTGGYVGSVAAVRRMLTWAPLHVRTAICNHWPGGDQAYLMEYCLANPDDVALDTKSELFQCMFGVPPDVLEVQGGRVQNAFTGNRPLFIHFNGKGCIDWMLRLHTALHKSLRQPERLFLPPAAPASHVFLPPYTAHTELRALAAADMLPRAHVRLLEKLRDNGFEPHTIYDIGACVLHWTRHAERVWPEAEVVLFDAFEHAEALYGQHQRWMGVLSDCERPVVWYQNDTYPGGNSYLRELPTAAYDLFPEGTGVERCARPLDDVVKEFNLPLPELIKVDVQGAEVDVLKGARKTLQSVRFLIVELQHKQYNEGAHLASESIPFIESLGFKCVAARFCEGTHDADYLFERV